jgi:transcriptional regulator with XRE-family HTH domain
MLQLFGAKLRYLRRQQRLTQKDVSHRLQIVRQSHISLLEQMLRTPSLEVVIRVASIFEMTTDYLLCDEIAVEAAAEQKTVLPIQQNSPQLFGAKLRHLRSQQKEFYQADLAKRLSVKTQTYISLLETGYSLPSIDLVLEIAQYFSVTTDYLLRDTMSVESIKTRS